MKTSVSNILPSITPINFKCMENAALLIENYLEEVKKEI